MVDRKKLNMVKKCTKHDKCLNIAARIAHTTLNYRSTGRLFPIQMWPLDGFECETLGLQLVVRWVQKNAGNVFVKRSWQPGLSRPLFSTATSRLSSIEKENMALPCSIFQSIKKEKSVFSTMTVNYIDMNVWLIKSFFDFAIIIWETPLDIKRSILTSFKSYTPFENVIISCLIKYATISVKFYFSKTNESV